MRTLRRSPGFAIVAVLTMALGIGATTAIFSVVDAALLRPLPYAHPEQLVWVEDDLPGVPARDVGMSQPELVDLRRSGIFEHVSPAWFDENNLTGSSRPARVKLDTVAPSYFTLLGIGPQLGRTFDPAYNAPGYMPEVVISDGLWKRLFGADPHILDLSIRLDTDLYRIIGVMPAGFRPPGRTTDERSVEVWAAMSFYGAPLPDQPARNWRFIPGAMARLAPGVSVADAQRRVDGLVSALQREYPSDYPKRSAWTVHLSPLKQTVVGDVRQSLMLLLGAVGLVLVIAAVNVANLLLARGSARGREMAIRQALGAARARLMRQLLTESVLLALLGGATGVGVLMAATRMLLEFVPDTLPRLNDISIDWRVLLFSLGASLVSGVAFGLVPALHVDRAGLAHRLKQQGRATTASGGQARTRRLLVVAQFALSLVLLVAAGLLVRSFWDLLNARLGFNPDRVMSVRTRLPYPNDSSVDRYKTVAQKTRFAREILRRVRELPGVEDAAVGDSPAIPLDHTLTSLNRLPVTFERGTELDQPSLVEGSVVTPEYFHLMGMSLVRGRFFTDLDTEQVSQVAVVNEAMAHAYWPHEEALGKHFKLSQSAQLWTTVVGIVADARTETLADAHVPHVYANLYQYERGAKHLAIFLRGYLDRAAIPDAVREQVQAIDPTLPVFGAEMLTDAVSASLTERRFSLEMVGAFAVTALFLASLGVYGVMSYIVSERSHEIGVRLALGAEARTILLGVLRQGLTLALAGAGVGVGCAYIVTRVMAALLYGVAPMDPPTYAAVAALLIGVSAVACYLPARRAMRVDLMAVLRRD